MKKFILMLLVMGVSSRVFSQTLGYGQVSVLCPKEVICTSADPKSCHLSDNSYDLWDKPTLNDFATSTIAGTYPLDHVSVLNFYDEKNIKKPLCRYSNGRWSNYRSFSMFLKYADTNRFNWLKKESSSWKDNGNCLRSDSNVPLVPELCPFVQAPGIAIFDDTKIKLFYPNPNAYFEPNYIANKWLSYDQLYKYCGATSNCIIDIGVCDGENENCSSYGDVSLDISAKQIVKIIQINSYKAQGNHYIFKQKSPFNMIYSEIDTKNSK